MGADKILCIERLIRLWKKLGEDEYLTVKTVQESEGLARLQALQYIKYLRELSWLLEPTKDEHNGKNKLGIKLVKVREEDYLQARMHVLRERLEEINCDRPG